MARPSKQREIQVQKPAQSLAHFQSKLGQAEIHDGGLLKPILIGAGIVMAVGLAVGAWWTVRQQRIEKHEAALALLEQAVDGDGITPVPPAMAEAAMRARLPQLEALVRSAPASRREVTQGLLATWQVCLDGKSGIQPEEPGPWGRLRLAQRAIELGQAQEARQQLAPLRAKAGPDQAWGEAYWTRVLDTDRVAGDRNQAWKDLAEFKARFKGQPDSGALDNLLPSI
jgi:hypothetical protein